MQISIRDYRGVERADIEIAPIALVAGRNEQGKSCLAEAVRCVLTGNAIVVPGVTKKAAAALVRDGADEGHAKLESDQGVCIVSWPRAIVTAEVNLSNDMAAGLSHLVDMTDKERAAALCRQFDTEPDKKDVLLAVQDVGYGDVGASRVWDTICVDGWDNTHRKAKEHGANLKGQWEGKTGEKYGAKKAETWQPDNHPIGKNENDLLADIEKLEETHLARVGSLAVDSSLKDQLTKTASVIPALLEEKQVLTRAHDKLFDDYDLLPRPQPLPKAPMDCPACAAPILLENEKLVLAKDPPTPAKLKKLKKEADTRQANLDNAHAAWQKTKAGLQAVTDQLAAAERAKKELDKLSEKSGTTTQAEVDEAKKELDAARASLNALTSREAAKKIHVEIQKNDRLVAVLAADGLRRRKLSDGLDRFNSELASLCGHAGWPAVRFDSSLKAHYGDRPLWAASKSGQWRARLVIQAACALADKSQVIVIDEADILDAKGRNGMIALLQKSGLRALVCMTINKPDLVPNLEQAGIGKSYWIENGIAESL